MVGRLNGAFVYDGETWVKAYPEQDGSAGIYQVESMVVDPGEQVWLVSSQDAIVFQKGSWTPVIPIVGSSEISIRSVDVDPWCAVWFLSSEGVLCYLL